MMQMSSCDTIQDFVELLTAEVGKMSEEEKFEFRRGVRKAFRMRMTTTPKIGDTVMVELFSGHKILGVVKAVYDSVSGKKFQVCSGDISVKVEEGQIIVE
jgi:hypothetical protein